MEESLSITQLEDFAKECLRSRNYPEHIHNFSLFKCGSCKSIKLKLTIEYHTGSEEWNFRGIIWGECTSCGYLMRLFTFTGEHRQKLREERPECDCGNKVFISGICERIEGDQGIPGFCDEGVITGKCTSCNRNKAIVFID